MGHKYSCRSVDVCWNHLLSSNLKKFPPNLGTCNSKITWPALEIPERGVLRARLQKDWVLSTLQTKFVLKGYIKTLYLSRFSKKLKLSLWFFENLYRLKKFLITLRELVGQIFVNKPNLAASLIMHDSVFEYHYIMFTAKIINLHRFCWVFSFSCNSNGPNER